MSIENSSARKLDVFFYGLYMDPDILAAKGVTPSDPRRAVANGYALRLGARATMLRTSGLCVHGMVFAVTHADLQALYHGLDAYCPEALLLQTEAQGSIAALTMLLLAPPSLDEANPEYAAKLRISLAKLGFPAAYVETVR